MESVSVSKSKLQVSLLLLRLGIFIVFAMWTIDKFLNPEHAASVFERYYQITGLSTTLAYGVGAVQAILILAFVTGTFKTISYSIITLLHMVSTLSTYKQLMDPWSKPNLLFYTSITMLCACVALWLLREHDNLLSVDAMRKQKS